MKICNACRGTGEVNYEICSHCDGEGVDQTSTFTVGKVRRSKKAEFEVTEKKIKFDKKNAQRLI